MAATDFRSSIRRADGVFIVAVGLLSLIWYVTRLGFYSDDWAFLGMYATSPDQTLRGLYDASYSSQHAMRPVQLWLCAALYRVFGMDPAGYHAVNAVLVVLNPLIVYAIGRELQVSRLIALPVALVYGLLPNYSTDRYWYVAFAITLSMTACLASLYADLRAAGAANLRTTVSWKIAAVLALIAGVLAYEVVMPLLLVAGPVLVAWRVARRQDGLTRQRLMYAAALIAINIVLLGSIAMFKLKTTIRLGAEQGVAAQVTDIARHAIRTDLPRGEYGLNVFNALRVHFVEYGIQLVPNALSIGRTTPSGVRALALLVALITFGFLAYTLRSEQWPTLSSWATLVGAGLAVFALGYAIFVTNYNVQFTPTGIANRSAIAATLGAAMCLVGCAGGAATLARVGGLRVLIFTAAIAVIAGSGVAIVNGIAEQWVTAYAAERNILSSIRTRVPALPPHSTLLLEGACPYIGPAVVFEANWDLAGALQVYYRDRTLAANVVSHRMTADESGITATIYGQPTRYPYSASLLAFHAGTGEVQPLPDAATARTWLSRSLASWSCPAGQEGIGVEPF